MQIDAWTPTQIGEIAWEVSDKSQGGEEVLSCTKHHGFVPSLEYFDKQVFSKNTDTYKLVKRGQFAYATIHLDEGSVDCLTIRDEGIISPMYTVFDVDDARVDRGFLLELLQTPMMLDRYAAIGQGSVNRRKSISFDTLGMETIQLPPLPEQKKIAAILASVDEAIQATEAVIEQTRRVKEGLLQDLLTRGIGHSRFKQTEIGEIPESWDAVPCATISRQISVGIVVQPTQYYAERGIKCWRSANIGPGYVRDEEWVHITPEANEQLSKSRLDAGDIVVVRTGYPGTACVVPPSLDQTNCVDILLVRPVHESVLSDFLCWFINSDVGKRQVLAGQGGGAQQHFNVKELKRMVIAVPPLAEQREIVQHLSKMQALEHSEEAKVTTLQQVKAGLLQDLLTGAVRVSP